MPAIEAEYRTARQMKDLLASRKASALELLDLHPERVGKLNPVFNAVVVNLWRPVQPGDIGNRSYLRHG